MLTSSLKLSVLCERLGIRIVISGLLIVSHGFRFREGGVVDLKAWSPPGYMSAARQIGFAFGFWTHSLEMDEWSEFSWFKPGM